MISRILLCSVALFFAVVHVSAQLGRLQVFILIGPPGSGKSLQAKELGRTYKVPVVSMSSLLNEGIRKNTSAGRALASSIASGELLNDEAANELIKTRLLRSDAGRGFILDGYPTTPAQAEALDAFLKERNFPKPVVVVLDVPDDVLRERMTSRGRADDSSENMERRIREYRDAGSFTAKWYGSDHTIHVDGSGTPQAVAQSISRHIDSVRTSRGLVSRPEGESGLKQRPVGVSNSPAH